MSFPDNLSGDAQKKDHIKGCLLGGAIGDALGGPIEFYALKQIRQQFGMAGVTGFEDFRKVGIHGAPEAGQITDDTQMTLFTAEGLLRAECRGRERGIFDPAAVVYHAYLRWYHTQYERSNLIDQEMKDDGWLIQIPALHHRRAPGNTCLSALQSGKMGTVKDPINQSKGCGGVMRAAPAGLFPLGRDPFELGMEIAAITHGHPSGFLSAGCLAQLVNDIIAGESLPQAVDQTMLVLRKQPAHGECLGALIQAMRMWEEDQAGGTPSPERVELLGGGWVAEEALAIGVYCALSAGDDFDRGIQLAVNHSGDSDSTGSITGNLMGGLLGKAAIPVEWLEVLELKAEIEAIAEDLDTGFRDTEEWNAKYPGW
jgi:ADP-ribosylglycohydrolase